MLKGEYNLSYRRAKTTAETLGGYTDTWQDPEYTEERQELWGKFLEEGWWKENAKNALISGQFYTLL